MLYAMMLALLLHDMLIVVGTWQSYGPSESNKGSTSMGLSFLLSWNWFAAARSISLGEKEANRNLRSFGFRRSNSSNMMVSGVSHDAVMEWSLSFRNWDLETPKLGASVPVGEQAADDVTLQPSVSRCSELCGAPCEAPATGHLVLFPLACERAWCCSNQATCRRSKRATIRCEEGRRAHQVLFEVYCNP